MGGSGDRRSIKARDLGAMNALAAWPVRRWASADAISVFGMVVALCAGCALFAYTLFGAGLVHLGHMANDRGYRPLVLLLLTAVALDAVLAFTAGELIGGPKLLAATSPNKTVSGALGALLGTTGLVAALAAPIFADTPLDRWYLLLGLGAIVNVAGQAGDLMLSSIKRDLGIKDMGVVIPGHGGLLDRFNSLLLVAPAVFHYVGYYVGFGLYQPTRLFTG